MSKKGGYKILDLSTNPTYDEIAEVLDTEKTILVSGLVVSGELQKDVFASVEEVEGVYTLKTPEKVITIDSENGVIVKENIMYKHVITLSTSELNPVNSREIIIINDNSYTGTNLYQIYNIVKDNLYSGYAIKNMGAAFSNQSAISVTGYEWTSIPPSSALLNYVTINFVLSSENSNIKQSVTGYVYSHKVYKI